MDKLWGVHENLQRISQAKQHISQVTLPALQRISQAKQRISQVTLPRPLWKPVFPLGFWLVQICPNDKFIEIFAQRFHCITAPFFKFFALNLLFEDTSYCLALKYSSFLFKFFSFAFYNINFWFKISKICLKISHFSQISHSRGNTDEDQMKKFCYSVLWRLKENFLKGIYVNKKKLI